MFVFIFFAFDPEALLVVIVSKIWKWFFSQVYGIFSTSREGVPVIPEGFFIMGSDKGNKDEQPERNIFVSTFVIDETEVSKKKYAKCVKAGVCNIPLEGKELIWGVDGKDHFPINGVSWFDARNYCQFIEKRLPTEAEWEKTASWTTDAKTKFSNGKDDINCAAANFKNIGDDLCRTTEVKETAFFREK